MGMDIFIIIVRVPVLKLFFGVQTRKQVGDRDLPGTAVHTVPAGRAGDQAPVSYTHLTLLDPEDESSGIRENVFRACFIDPFQGEKMAEYLSLIHISARRKKGTAADCADSSRPVGADARARGLPACSFPLLLLCAVFTLL